MKFNTVVCGGTFDHFHKGHESFLKYVFSVGDKVIVGITSDQYIRSSKLEAENLSAIRPFEERRQTVLEFVKSEGVLDRTEIVEINDLFGPTLSKELLIDAIVVSEETKKGAELINKERKELDLTQLKIIIAPSIKAQDGNIISSGRIRNGEINREGNPYINPLWFDKDLELTENLREEFQRPFGELLTSIEGLLIDENNLIITVGDITAKTFNEKTLGQNISVIDFKVAREQKFSNISELGFKGDERIFTADNPAGFITSGLLRTISEIFKSDLREKTILRINGEEDLVVLPLVLFSPLTTIIYYGQPGQGLVKVVVSEESKNRAHTLISKLKSL